MRVFFLVLAVVPLFVNAAHAQAEFPAPYAGEPAWSDSRIVGLAPEIRTRVLAQGEACGTPFSVTSAFARPTYHRAPVIALHYESLWCEARGEGICRGDDCLHEVYVRDGERFRLAFRGFVKDVHVNLDGSYRILR